MPRPKSVLLEHAKKAEEAATAASEPETPEQKRAALEAARERAQKALDRVNAQLQNHIEENS